MDGTIERFDALICSGARLLTGYERRLFVAEVAAELCGGSAAKPNDALAGDGPRLRRDCMRLVRGCGASGELRRTRPAS